MERREEGSEEPTQEHDGARTTGDNGLLTVESKAVSLLRRSSDLGHAEATFNLAVCFALGLGCVSDQETAFDLYESAARQGMSSAQYNVGVAYRDAHGISRNLTKALEYLGEAAASAAATHPPQVCVLIEARAAAAGVLLTQAACLQANITTPQGIVSIRQHTSAYASDTGRLSSRQHMT